MRSAPLFAFLVLCGGFHDSNNRQAVPLKYLPRIGIRAGGDRAVFTRGPETGPFFIKGFNYIRLRGGDHATFDADTGSTKAHYDPERAEAMFRVLEAAGGNAVRVFVIGRNKGNPGIAGNPESTKGVYGPYMDNVIDFLRRATRHGLYVFPTFGDGELPISRHYQAMLKPNHGWGNGILFTREGIEAKKTYMTDFLRAIKERDPGLLSTILGVQCQNEIHVTCDRWPFTVIEGKLPMPNGKSYDMASDRERRLLMDEGLRHYHNEIAKAVKAVDPEVLVAEGIFTMRAVGKTLKTHEGIRPDTKGDKRYPPGLPTLGPSALDFMDIHFYPVRRGADLKEDFRADMDSSLLYAPEMKEIRKKKPILLGEFGAFRHVQKDFPEVERQMLAVRDLAAAEVFNGWLYWTYDCKEQEPLWNAMDGGEGFVRKLSGTKE
jgi:hypothetical protein